jgi:dTDP-4-dehydrorhamnose reductase
MSENPATRILITGSEGQLGRALAAACQSRGLDFEGRDIDTLDVGNQDEVTRWVSARSPMAVVNCAAYTAVDECESDEATALRVNGSAVGHLASACNIVGARLVHISTDYVFAGDGDRPYREDDPVAPIGAYGRTKLAGEIEARNAHLHLVIRTAWLYGHGGKNFVETIRRQITDGSGDLRVVADQRGSPTFSGDLAEAILDLVAAGCDGVVHAVNRGETTWHGFAVAIAELLEAEVEIEKVSSSEFPRPAPRPAYSVLDTSRLSAVLGREMPPWKEALARYLGVACES